MMARVTPCLTNVARPPPGAERHSRGRLCHRAWLIRQTELKPIVRIVALAGALLAWAGAGAGCSIIRYKAWLDADSASERPGYFLRGPQYVHVDEEVKLQFLVMPQMDTYTVFEFPGRTVILPANPDYANYWTSVKFAQPSDPQNGYLIRATAYRTRGQQDRQVVGDEVMPLLTRSDPADERLTSAEIRLIVYQSRVLMDNVGGPDVQPDWAASKLRILADDGKRVSEVSRAGPDAQGGYTVRGPDSTGRFELTYLPTAEQVNRGGTTTAEFTLVDRAGRSQVIRKDFSTP